MKSLLALSVLFYLAVADPQPPVYPPVFTVSFFETQTLNNKTGTTYGMSYYDGENGLYRQDRYSGITDIMCALALPMTTDTGCNHLVVDGNRYMHYPESNQCCYCCSDANGCGALHLDWLTGADFLGEQNIYWTDVYAWNQSGNIYYETIADSPENRIPVGLTREPFDFFDYQAYTPGVPDGVFALPSECSTTNVCQGLCVLFRNNMTETQLS